MGVAFTLITPQLLKFSFFLVSPEYWLTTPPYDETELEPERVR